MTRLLSQTLPHLALGAALAGLALLPWLWLRLTLVVLAAALLREWAQAQEKDRWTRNLVSKVMNFDEFIMLGGDPVKMQTEIHAQRGLARFWPAGWLRSRRRWADIAELLAGSALVAGAAWVL